MDHQSRYSPGLAMEFVNIPSQLLTFLRQHRGCAAKYIPLPGSRMAGGQIAITYKTIEGNNPEEVPIGTFTAYGKPKKDTFLFTNPSETDRQVAAIAARAALRHILGPGVYSGIRKFYMLAARTLPVKIKFRRGGRGARESLYVKTPCTSRLACRFLYDIISGIPGICYGFNRAVFLEEGIKGSLVSKIDESRHVTEQAYREGFARAAVHAEFLGLDSDVVFPANRIVGPDMNTILFDFNLFFRPNDRSFKDGVNYMKAWFDTKYPGVWNREMERVFRLEKHAVARRVNRRRKGVSRFARIVGEHLSDHSGMITDERIRRWHGADGLEDYFEKKIGEYRDA